MLSMFALIRVQSNFRVRAARQNHLVLFADRKICGRERLASIA
jgi:hypothetical protein